jgi:cytochrome c-type biogenesis protein CcmH
MKLFGSRRRGKGAPARAAENGHRRSRRPTLPSLLALVAAGMLVGGGLLIAADRTRPPQTLDDQVQEIASGLGCVTCQNLSVADSPAGTARAMRAEIRRRLDGGDTAAEIKAFFVEKYGEKILLSPRSVIPWVVPGLALAGGIALLAWSLGRRSEHAPAEPRLTAAERARIRRELAGLQEPD